MKKLLCIFQILIILSVHLCADSTQHFSIEFAKSLPLTITFYDPAVYTNPSSNAPPVEITSLSFSSDQYGDASEKMSFGIFWDLDPNTIFGDGENPSLSIDMYFYAESSFVDSFNYMMRSDLDSTAGLNYNVTNIEKSDGSTDLADGSIQVTDPAGTLTIDERTISLVSGHTGREHKTDWYVFEIQVPGFESTTLPLGSYSGSIAVVFESVV